MLHTPPVENINCLATHILFISNDMNIPGLYKNNKKVKVFIRLFNNGFVVVAFSDSLNVWCPRAFSPLVAKFYVSFYVKKKNIHNFMCLL